MEFIHDTLGQRVVLASGRAREVVAQEVSRLGGMRVMVIAGQAEAQLADQVTASLDVTLRWGQVRQHVPLELARRARESAERAGVDVIVSVGGGSTTGLAKAVAMEVDAQIIAVPTTYAGSEATDVWGLTEEGTKTTGVDGRVLPVVVVYDAELTLSLPTELTVASGLNGLAHCVDSLWAPRADPINLALALEGARALALGLPSIVDDPTGRLGRERCLYGAYLSAVAFASAGSGMHHKICHVLGGAYDLPHASTHAVILPYVLAYNAAHVPELAGRLAEALGAERSLVESDPAGIAVATLQSLRTRLDAPRSLADVGMAEADLPDAVDRILTRIPESNPAAVTPAGLHALLRAAWAGDTPTITTEGADV